MQQRAVVVLCGVLCGAVAVFFIAAWAGLPVLPIFIVLFLVLPFVLGCLAMALTDRRQTGNGLRMALVGTALTVAFSALFILFDAPVAGTVVWAVIAYILWLLGQGAVIWYERLRWG